MPDASAAPQATAAPIASDAPAITSNGVTLDFEASGGYDGDYVVIMNPDYPEGEAKNTGTIGFQTDSGIPQFELSPAGSMDLSVYECPTFGQSDPYAQNVGVNDGYDMTDGDEWQEGFIKGFYFNFNEYSCPADNYMAFKVLYVGEHCRIWTPANPEYKPLDLIDEGYAKAAADEFDSNYDHMTGIFGFPHDSRGDGKVNIMFYNINPPTMGGFTDMADEYDMLYCDDMEYASNALPMIHIDTFGTLGVTRLDDSQNPTSDISRCFPIMAHEFQHLIYHSNVLDEDWVTQCWQYRAEMSEEYSKLYADYNWITEFLSTAATALCYPKTIEEQYVAFWYNKVGTYKDAVKNFVDNGYECVRANEDYPIHSGVSILTWTGARDVYCIATYISIMAYEKLGDEAFKLILDAWNHRGENGVSIPMDAIMSALGYKEFEPFFEDLVLTMLIHDDAAFDGKYALGASEKFKSASTSGNMFELLRPAVACTDNIDIEPAGYIVIKSASKSFTPPEDAAEGLKYIGVTLK